MKSKKHSGNPLDTRKYLIKFGGLDIIENAKDLTVEDENETIVLERWVRRDFPEMGFTSYKELDPQ
jgi:hypothetical protein